MDGLFSSIGSNSLIILVNGVGLSLTRSGFAGDRNAFYTNKVLRGDGQNREKMKRSFLLPYNFLLGETK